jgi:DNA invertase Pin-like site-specific DNA recombinase
VAFVSLSEQLDLTNPAGRMMAGILAIFAQFEREMIDNNPACLDYVSGSQ